MVVVQRRHDVQRAEPAGEGDVLLRRHREVAEHQQAGVEPGLLNAAEFCVRQVVREVEADDLGAEAALDGPDFCRGDRLAHRALSAVGASLMQASKQASKQAIQHRGH